ncbi:inactive Rho GTPase-activating protein 11B [Nothobranchius furzeri]|uniref:Rho GTPase activating protein 11B n=1 Tax=Nothobranchius furzeri TaxID=105023 RepID=A0A9D3C1H8_NOTFU|nr:inactive Rho GTPase-activating protein 11B [Nothobranchius furzeri]KAF7230917.1 Rho GTPase activating protein 11B [Nothobranchius furzeri]
MKLTNKNVIRFHLQALYGISVKNLEEKKERQVFSGAKIFGVPLENLSRCYIPELGLVPCFLVDACSFLLERVGTVGLFRKPGSLHRIKILRAKLNRGEGCLSTSFPYDIATLVKQFCRELPEPLIPSELHAALLKAQELSNQRDRTSAFQLLSCLLPARNSSCLQYLFNFLCKVSKRCTDNLMTSSNLATVFAPCLLPPPNKAEMSEERIELRVLVLQNFIENPHSFGLISKDVMDSIEFLMNFPFPKDTKKANQKRHSLKAIRFVKTGPWIHKPKVKRGVSEPSFETPPGARQKLRRSLGLESFPNIQLFRTCVSHTGMDFKSADELCKNPSLSALDKMQPANWRRRSSP